MEILKFLQSIRNPVLDTFFAAVTKLGEESPLIVISFFLLWCANKKYGYYLYIVGAASLVSNLFFKIIFRVPRPWVLDTSFSIVESAREAAEGYSFPSGHTQIAVALYGGIARAYQKKAVRIFCVILAVLIGFSRMYLGVHTLQDVMMAAVISVIFIFLFYKWMQNAFLSIKRMDMVFLALTVFCVVHILYSSYFPFPKTVDVENLYSGIENGYKVLGTILALWISYRIDEKYIRYDTKCVWWGQVVKLTFGVLIAVLIKTMLKQPLMTLFGGHFFAGTVRYFAMAIFAACIWPMTFRFYPQKGV